MEFPGLYFPYIRVRDADWLKRAALYWPSIARLRPRGYPVPKSGTDAELHAAGILVDADPARLLTAANWDLAKTLRGRLPELSQRFGLGSQELRDATAWAPTHEARSWHFPDLAWIHVTKFPAGLIDELQQSGVAIRGSAVNRGANSNRSRPDEWLGLHPALGGAYMAALVGQLSRTSGYSPITDQLDLRQATPTTEFAEAIDLLLGDAARPETTGPTAWFVMLALQHIQPASTLSVDDVIRIRTELAGELELFRDFVQDQRDELAQIAALPDRDRQSELFADRVRKSVEIPLQRLEKSLRLLSFETTRSLMMTSSIAPPVAVAPALAATHSPAIFAAGGVATAVGSAWWSVSAGRRARVAQSPVGYLLDVRDSLTPKTFTSRARHLFKGTYGR